MGFTLAILKDQSRKFDNPWAAHRDYVYLGAVRCRQWVRGTTHVERLELYALESPNPGLTQFGARYGNEPEEYYSGGAGFWTDITSPSKAGIAAKAWVNTQCGLEWSYGITNNMLYER